jgi:hypothetical protein
VTTDIQTKPLDAVRYSRMLGADDRVTVTVTLPRAKLEKLHAFLDGDAWEKAQAARDANLAECSKSIAVLLNTTRQHHGTSGGRVCATLLASLYNGNRVKLDVSDLKLLDGHLFECALNTVRLCFELNMEPHEFFENGGRLFEEMISTWGLEKKRRAPR